MDITALTDGVQDGAALVFLQSVSHPWGKAVSSEQLRPLLSSAPPDCVILLDQCHEHFGPAKDGPAANLPLVGAKGSAFIRIQSMSKQWAAPGLKSGWIRAREEFVSKFDSYASATYGGPPSVFPCWSRSTPGSSDCV